MVASNDGTDKQNGHAIIHVENRMPIYVVATFDEPEQEPGFWLLDSYINNPNNMDLRDFSFANFMEHIPVRVCFFHKNEVQVLDNKFLKMGIDEILIFADIPRIN